MADNVHECQVASEFVCVDTSERDLSVGSLQLGSRCERNSNKVRIDEALSKGVIGDGGWTFIGIGEQCV